MSKPSKDRSPPSHERLFPIADQLDAEMLASWYDWWIKDQAMKQPESLFSSIPNFDFSSYDTWTSSLSAVGLGIHACLSETPSASIDEITTELFRRSILVSPNDNSLPDTASDLVFAVLGWQTMLYRSDFNSCHPSQLCIADETDGYRSQAQICLKQTRKASKKRLHDLLLGFGVMLPPANLCPFDLPEEKEAFNQIDDVDTASFNAKLLATVGGLTITWIDCLSCHLELDLASKTLFLFRYPSFCAANPSPNKSGFVRSNPIYFCAAESRGSAHWATEDDVVQLLQEIILSYRLLFGRAKQSRQYFRKLNPFQNIPLEGRDSFLVSLCSQKNCAKLDEAYERGTYSLKQDFPHLRSRLISLNIHLSKTKPRSWKEMWLDKRDSANWLTFWAVIIIGSLGIFLAFLQVLLQILQLVLQTR
jgi:hypothetical protein